VCGVRGLDAGLVEDADHGAAAAGQLGLLLHHRVSRLNSEQPVSQSWRTGGPASQISRERIVTSSPRCTYLGTGS
jgi:hypothetical protein